MHLGNLWSSLLAWLAARSAGGRMVLRLEDLDPDRCTQAWCDQVMRDLEWLGLDWDNEPVYQSRRTPAYEAAFRQLEEKRLVYPCFCTRAERMAASAPHRSDGQAVYDGRCRRLTAEQREDLARQRNPAWRLAVPDRASSFRDLLQGMYEENLLRDCGDFILRRSDGVYAYQLAVVVDDAWMGVTQVVRGSDLLSSTPRQRDQELGALQQRFTARELVGRLAHLAGLIPEAAPVSPEELVPLFAWEKLPRRDIAMEPW